jgi:hypothetical protein
MASRGQERLKAGPGGQQSSTGNSVIEEDGKEAGRRQIELDFTSLCGVRAVAAARRKTHAKHHHNARWLAVVEPGTG